MEYTVKQAYQSLKNLSETTRLEAKKCTQIGDSIMQTVCAFANTPQLNGGYLLLGVSEPDETHDNFWVSGIEDTDKILNELHNNCRTQFEMPIAIQAQIAILENKKVILVYVPELDNHAKPCRFTGKFGNKNKTKTGVWFRGANGDFEATQKELEPLILAKMGKSFEEIYFENAEWGDLDLNAIARYRELRGRVNPEAPELLENNQEMLFAMNLVNRKNNYQPNIAGLLLFGKASALRRLLPTVRVDYVRVSGNHYQQENFEITLDVREPLIYAIPKLEQQILSDMPRHFRLEPNQLQRSDMPLLPQKVVRETLVNAVMHRDYQENQPTLIVRYDDRLEVKNAGYSLKPVEELGTSGSKTRNSILASVLYDMKFAENKGSGIGVIKRQLRQAMLAEPQFESNLTSNYFLAVYPFSQLLNEHQLAWITNLKDFSLDNDEVMALILAKENGQVKNTDLCEITKAHSEQAGKILGKLVKIGLLDKFSKGRGAYYQLSQLAKSHLPTENLLSTELIGLNDKPIELNDNNQAQSNTLLKSSDKPDVMQDTGVFANTQPTELNGKPSELNNKNQEKLPEKSSELPNEILGKRASKTQMKQTLLQLCQTPKTLTQLMTLTNRKEATLRPILRELVRMGNLRYLYENNPTHPAQAYITV